MALFDFCSMTFLIGVVASIFIIVSIYGYITYKMTEQDHKISTMLGIISSMAQEQEFLRNKITNKVGGRTDEELSLETKNINNIFNNNINNRIEVSDDDEDEDEDEDESEDEDSEDGDSDDEDSDNERDDDDDIEEQLSKTIINIHLGNEENNEHSHLIETNVDTFSDDESSLSLESVSGSESSNMTKVTHLPNVKTIHLEDPITINVDSLPSLQNDNLDFLKTLHITSEENDYKKMPVQKLRNIIIEKGIVEDASKLKKPELLKLIEGI